MLQQNLQVSNKLGLHIEPTNICTLKCPGCERTRFLSQFGAKNWQNQIIDVDALMAFLDCDLNNASILLCGNSGDPIYHPDFHRLVQLLKSRGAVLEIVTNGSYKSAAWWSDLCDLLSTEDSVTFSIDGLPTNFDQYRINADWESIKTGIDAVVKSKSTAVWKYIPFKYNQDDVAAAQQLSKDFGMDRFSLEPSDRFDQQTEHYKPTIDFIGNRYHSQVLWRQHATNVSVDPACAKNQMHYVSAAGYYLPCCYIGDYRFYYKTSLWKFKEEYSIKNTTFTKILQGEYLTAFNKTLEQQPCCQFNCPTTNEKQNNTN